jgi:hypothetical protein
MVAIAFIYWDPVLVKGGTRISGRRFLPIHFSDFAFFRFRIFIFPEFFRRGFSEGPTSVWSVPSTMPRSGATKARGERAGTRPLLATRGRVVAVLILRGGRTIGGDFGLNGGDKVRAQR